jgi:hypothetical protein
MIIGYSISAHIIQDAGAVAHNDTHCFGMLKVKNIKGMINEDNQSGY